ncbi:MAG TPA: cytidine deaminase [Silvibacterium sp.]|nr:cytidine deaminase [Silvibacterium sp.]
MPGALPSRTLNTMPDSPPLSGNAAALQAAARKAAENAYAPYSGFRVGAALLFDDGFTATGCNVENMSYGLTVCAERTALFSAIAQRGSGHKIVAIAVTNLNGASSPPCGACRQVLSEFVSSDATISFPNDNGPSQSEVSVIQRPFAEIFPFTFHLDTK